jgi:hypothetical protein
MFLKMFNFRRSSFCTEADEEQAAKANKLALTYLTTPPILQRRSSRKCGQIKSEKEKSIFLNIDQIRPNHDKRRNSNFESINDHDINMLDIKSKPTSRYSFKKWTLLTALLDAIRRCSTLLMLPDAA